MLMCFTAWGTICLAGFWLAPTLLKCIFLCGLPDDKPLAREQIMFKIFSLLQVNFVPKIGTFQGTPPTTCLIWSRRLYIYFLLRETAFIRLYGRTERLHGLFKLSVATGQSRLLRYVNIRSVLWISNWFLARNILKSAQNFQNNARPPLPCSTLRRYPLAFLLKAFTAAYPEKWCLRQQTEPLLAELCFHLSRQAVIPPGPSLRSTILCLCCPNYQWQCLESTAVMRGW